jgi:RNA polymerase sigma-70 factor (ECF subfamily)
MNLHTLIREAKQGSQLAQQGLFNLFAAQMAMVCRRYVKSREDAEERLIDGFCKCFKVLPGFEYHGEAAFYTWLKTIMVHECLMFLRKKNTFLIAPATEAEEIAVEEDVLDKLSAAEICALIIQLPVGYRTVFNLYVVEGLPHAEIAKLLGISEGTSKSQLSKARALLQKLCIQKHSAYAARKIQ